MISRHCAAADAPVIDLQHVRREGGPVEVRGGLGQVGQLGRHQLEVACEGSTVKSQLVA